MIENTCAFPNCKDHAQKDSSMCLGHKKYFSGFESVEAAKPVNKISSTQKEVNKQYKKLSKIYLAKHPLCEVKLSPDCTVKADGIHHTNGRLKDNMLNVNTFKACCNECNTWIERNHLAAAKAGMKNSKFKTDPPFTGITGEEKG